ncbi:hypothetical protein ACIQUM_07710 [Amycolatopsis azurea]|uniref:hypothetical protein n=1 Tax=Amycolatopsis azurea TaxID=36819 RepID=UPI0037F5669B
MGADMQIATIAVPVHRTEPPDFDKARRMIASLDDAVLIAFGNVDDVDTEIRNLLPELDPATDVVDPHGQPMLDLARRACIAVVDGLEDALASREITSIVAGGYRIFVSGGLSSGDSPTDAAERIWNTSLLPDVVLRAMGFLLDYSEPRARRTGGQDVVTDTDVVDALALCLGTRTEWGSDEFEWIVKALTKVRALPGEVPPGQYVENFLQRYDVDPRTSPFLAEYVCKEAAEESAENDTALR